MKIGILGGTFNPIHKGHLNLAREACKKLKLNKVFFVPAYIPPHKNIKSMTSAKNRLKMVELAIKGNLKFAISDFEIKKKGKSYSVRTLTKFNKKFGKNAKLFFLTGADSIRELKKWKHIDRIFKLADFVIATRPKFISKKLPKGAIRLKIKPLDISSTQIRKKLKNKLSVDNLVPRSIANYIKQKGLYENG